MTWFFAGENNPSFILRMNVEGNQLGISAGERLQKFEPLLLEVVID